MDNIKLLSFFFQNNSHILPSKNLDTVLFPYLLGTKDKSIFLDLSKILPLYKKCLLLTREIFSQRGKVVLILDNKIPFFLEKELNKFFIIIKNNWAEGSITNFSILKKTNKILNEKGNLTSYKTSGFNSRKSRNQLTKFYKKSQTLGFFTSPPRLIISLIPVKNPLLFKEASLLNIPIISLIGQEFKITKKLLPSYPVIFNNTSLFMPQLFLRLLLLEAKKGSLLFYGKYKVRNLSLIQKAFFLKKVKVIL